MERFLLIITTLLSLNIFSQDQVNLEVLQYFGETDSFEEYLHVANGNGGYIDTAKQLAFEAGNGWQSKDLRELNIYWKENYPDLEHTFDCQNLFRIVDFTRLVIHNFNANLGLDRSDEHIPLSEVTTHFVPSVDVAEELRELILKANEIEHTIIEIHAAIDDTEDEILAKGLLNKLFKLITGVDITLFSSTGSYIDLALEKIVEWNAEGELKNIREEAAWLLIKDVVYGRRDGYY